MQFENGTDKDGKKFCSKCNGKGIYQWGASINGRATHRGKCFACQGKGVQTKKDGKRNTYYWNYCAKVW